MLAVVINIEGKELVIHQNCINDAVRLVSDLAEGAAQFANPDFSIAVRCDTKLDMEDY